MQKKFYQIVVLFTIGFKIKVFVLKILKTTSYLDNFRLVEGSTCWMFDESNMAMSAMKIFNKLRHTEHFIKKFAQIKDILVAFV